MPPRGQVPAGAGGAADWAAKVENIFSVAVEPHCSQTWRPLVPGFSRNAVT